jgi:hypothetical protein
MQADVVRTHQRVQLEFPVARGSDGALSQQLDDAAQQVGAEVVVHQMHGAHDGKRRAVELGMAVQSKGGAGRQGAYGAGGNVQLARSGQCFYLALGDALALFAAGISVGAGRVAASQHRRVAGIKGRHRPVVDGAIVPAAQFDGVGRPACLRTPAVDRVDLHDDAGLREIDRRLRIWLKCAIVVGDHHSVAAQRGAACVAGVLEKVEQPFIMQRECDKGHGAFVVLRREAAARIDGLVSGLKAPSRVQGTLLLAIQAALYPITGCDADFHIASLDMESMGPPLLQLKNRLSSFLYFLQC